MVDGGVLIVHQLHDGKHQYEVKSVLKHQKKKGEKFFLRRGDKLRLVNDTELQDVPPGELAEILSKGSPKVTVHKALKEKKPVVVDPSDEDTMVPVSKKEMTLRFSGEMIREGSAEEDQGEDEDDVCTEEEQREYLLVSMTKTTISVVAGRSCDPKEPCHECKVKCEYNDIVMLAERSTVTLVGRGGGGTFRLLRTSEAVMEHMSTSKYIHSLCSEKSVYVSPSYPPQNERITIYYYKSSDTSTKGVPVVLNFTGSDCFLRCCKSGEKVQLQTEVCDKQTLRSISKNDKQTLAYMFYMRSDPSRNHWFESALHRGWFIQVSEPDNNVCVVETAGPQEEQFFYIMIQTQRS